MNIKDKARNKTDGRSRKVASSTDTSKPKAAREDHAGKYNILLMTDRLHQRV